MSWHRSITESDLRRMASDATSMHLDTGVPLTDSVVKVASSRGDLTSEHLRRVCEMTYHDTYERMFRAGEGNDRYVSFDPPDADSVIQAVNGDETKTASAHRRATFMTPTPYAEKTASVQPRRFVSANAFDEMVKSAEAPAASWADPTGELRRVRNDLNEAMMDLDSQVGRSQAAIKIAEAELLAHSEQACKQGYPVDCVLAVCVGGLEKEGQATTPAGQDVLHTLAENLLRNGWTYEKTAAAVGEVNTSHPIALTSVKLAGLKNQRQHLEMSLGFIREDFDRANEELLALLT